MSVIDDQLRFPQNGSMVTHDQILAELIKQLDDRTVTGKAIADLLNIAPARITEMKKGAPATLTVLRGEEKLIVEIPELFRPK